jgi:hypothetical protein
LNADDAEIADFCNGQGSLLERAFRLETGDSGCQGVKRKNVKRHDFASRSLLRACFLTHDI